MVRWLSLDVVLGSVIFTNAVGHLAKAALPWSVSAAMGCCVWLIYTLDHLIDGNTLDQDPSMDRHVFHRKYRKVIFLLFLFVAGFGLWLLFLLPYHTLVYGCVLLGLVGLYFLSIWLFRIYFAKEIFIAVLYSCGIFLGSFSMTSNLDPHIYILFGQTVLLAAINLLLFSQYEVEYDLRDGHRSWVTHFGVEATRNHLRILFAILSLLIAANLYSFQAEYQLLVQLIFIGMSIIMGFIFLKPQWFRENERFRWVGDIVFMFPGLVYLL